MIDRVRLASLFGAAVSIACSGCTRDVMMDDGLGFGGGGEASKPAGSDEDSGSDGMISESWTTADGTAAVGTTTTDGTRDDSMCGDGIVEGDEVCDGEDFGGITCVDYGFVEGSLVCENCTDVGTDACLAGAGCGDGIVDAGEQCDGDDVQGFNCATLGLGEGTLSCSPGCAMDTTACVGDGSTDGGSGGDSGDACNGLGQGCIPIADPCCEGFDCYGICIPT